MESLVLNVGCSNVWPDLAVEVLPTMDSTNSELLRRARVGCIGPVLLVAMHQTEGRGRLDRRWHSRGATSLNGLASLTFSLGLPLAISDCSGLSLAVGVALAESLHPLVQLKWPNDLWWQGRKLAGILIETVGCRVVTPWSRSVRYTVIGIGMNVTRPVDAPFPIEPAWLTEIDPDTNAVEALQRLVAPLLQNLSTFVESGFAPFQARFNARDALWGVPVTMSDGSEGIADGVDPTGALRLRTAQGHQRVAYAEVLAMSVRKSDRMETA